MKIITLGDIHGRTIWKDIVEKEKNSDLFLFTGDYLDNYDNLSGEEELKNLEEILKFKQENLDRVILLIGNHCFHYMKNVNEDYSRYNWRFAEKFGTLLDFALESDLMQMCFQYENYIFTHAGITKTWVTNNNIDTNDLVNSINKLFKTNKNAFNFTLGANFNYYGDDVEQSPIWVRIPSLLKDTIDNVTQIVGHTQMNNILITDKLIVVDTLGTSQEYLVIENNCPRIEK